MRAADFFIAETAKTLDPDPWDPEFTTFERFNVELIDQLRRGPIQGSDDLSAAIGLAQLVDDELRRVMWVDLCNPEIAGVNA